MDFATPTETKNYILSTYKVGDKLNVFVTKAGRHLDPMVLDAFAKKGMLKRVFLKNSFGLVEYYRAR